MKVAAPSKIEVVIWDDASSREDTAWRDLDDTLPLDVVRCVSTGFVARDDDTTITLIPHIVESGDGVNYACFGEMSIPKGWIVKRIPVKTPKNLYKRT